MRISLVGASATLTACGSSGPSGTTADANTTIDAPATLIDAPSGPHIDANTHAPDANPHAPDAAPRPDADPNAPDAGPFTPANAGITAPQVPLHSGGVVLSAPVIVPVFFNDSENDPVPESAIESFLTDLAGGSYWGTTTSEYGVGPVTIAAAQHFSMPTPAQINETTLLQNLNTAYTGSSPAFGAPIDQSIYMFFIPSDKVFNSGGEGCCGDFYGYHDETTVNGQTVPYAIICSCDGAMDVPPVSNADDMSVTASHEAIESSTDPFFNENPAYEAADNNNGAWTILTGGELSDMCEYLTDADATDVPGTSQAQRSWSNVSAAAGHDPCVPQPANEVYFNSVPVLTETATLSDGFGDSYPSSSVTIAVGQSVTIPVKLWSEGPTSGPWTVQAWDYNDYTGGGAANLSFTWDQTTGQIGDTLNLTIHVVSKNNSLRGEVFIIESKLGDSDVLSVGAVTN